ncbi:carbohydrate kinase family protein [Devosia psychrophila]|uniref:Fructokinase n=1 Tax=Devosia psychrophila TaxID=728005 RepID=A0A1I1LEW2_9HYPH|nr:carbohydrate kinase [Devosia psychrophila]SFC69548.1 fructokinase [Devosia psychrophila]
MFVVGGESLIDLKAEVVLSDGTLIGRDGEDQIVMTAHPGGSPYNCAIALAKLGNDTGFLCPISADAFGDYLLGPLDEAGVTTLLTERVKEYTTLAVVNFDANHNARYGFYRSADGAIEARTAIAALPEQLDLYQIGGFCPIKPDEAAVWLEIVKAAIAKGATISIDPNVRPSLVADFTGFKARLSNFLDLAHVVKVSQEDLEALDNSRSIEQHAADLLDRANCELVVVTLGDRGSRAFTKSGKATAAIYSPPVLGDTVGAGDSLMAGILSWLNERDLLKPGKLNGLGDGALSDMLAFGAVVAGINCGRKGCKPPTRAEVDAVLGK